MDEELIKQIWEFTAKKARIYHEQNPSLSSLECLEKSMKETMDIVITAFLRKIIGEAINQFFDEIPKATDSNGEGKSGSGKFTL